MSVLVDADYVPSEEEPFMNERQKAYFRTKLLVWKSEILREARELEILRRKTPMIRTLRSRLFRDRQGYRASRA